MTALEIFIMITATWRLASLFANETGPFYIFEKIRKFAEHLSETNELCKAFHLHEGLTCEWCCSIWFSAPLVAAWFYFGDVVIWIALPLTLSAGAIFVKFVIQNLEQVQSYLVKMNTPPIPMKGKRNV